MVFYLRFRFILPRIYHDIFSCLKDVIIGALQGGITCGAIEDPRKSSKAIDERVIINFRDKNGVIARFRDKNVVIVRFCDKNVYR